MTSHTADVITSQCLDAQKTWKIKRYVSVSLALCFLSAVVSALRRIVGKFSAGLLFLSSGDVYNFTRINV